MIFILLGVPLAIGLWVILSLKKLDKKSTSRATSASVRRPQPDPRVTKVIPKATADGFKAVKTEGSEATPEFDIKVCLSKDRTLREPAPSSDKREKWPPPMFPEPTGDEKELLAEEKKFRKMATALKKEKRYDEAVECLRKAREFEYRTSFYYDCRTLLRVPEYLILAKRFDEAFDEAMAIANFKWPVAGMVDGTMDEAKGWLRGEALRVAMRAGHGADDSAKVREVHRLMKEEEEAIGRGRVADIKKEFEKHYRDSGCDVGRITEHCDCVPVVLLKKWNGRYISVLGKVKGLPTLDDAYEAGIFAADCCSHRVYPVFPEFDDLPKWLIEKIGLTGA